jgi:hypothetical protein
MLPPARALWFRKIRTGKGDRRREPDSLRSRWESSVTTTRLKAFWRAFSSIHVDGVFVEAFIGSSDLRVEASIEPVFLAAETVGLQAASWGPSPGSGGKG